MLQAALDILDRGSAGMDGIDGAALIHFVAKTARAGRADMGLLAEISADLAGAEARWLEASEAVEKAEAA